MFTLSNLLIEMMLLARSCLFVSVEKEREREGIGLDVDALSLSIPCLQASKGRYEHVIPPNNQDSTKRKNEILPLQAFFPCLFFCSNANSSSTVNSCNFAVSFTGNLSAKTSSSDSVYISRSKSSQLVVFPFPSQLRDLDLPTQLPPPFYSPPWSHPTSLPAEQQD